MKLKLLALAVVAGLLLVDAAPAFAAGGIIWGS
jgi:hypothetical protein